MQCTNISNPNHSRARLIFGSILEYTKRMFPKQIIFLSVIMVFSFYLIYQKFSSVSRFTFEEYEGNTATAVGLKGRFTILFSKCFIIFCLSSISELPFNFNRYHCNWTGITKTNFLPMSMYKTAVVVFSPVMYRVVLT